MPHGGMKQSGYGKDMSMYGLEDYTAIRHVMVKLDWAYHIGAKQTASLIEIETFEARFPILPLLGFAFRNNTGKM